MDRPAPAPAAPGPNAAPQPLNQQMQQRNSLMPPPKQASGLPGRGLARAGGRPRKDWVRDQLGEDHTCKHCGKGLSKNVTYQASHLVKCGKFLDSAEAISIDAVVLSDFKAWLRSEDDLRAKYLFPEHVFRPSIIHSSNPLDWWQDNGHLLPALQQVALFVLSICPHAASAERTWSRFGEVLSSKRCSMLMGRVGLLAYVQYNYRVASRLARAPVEQEWSEFLAWLDTLPPLKGVRPGVTTTEAEASASGSGSQDGLSAEEGDGETSGEGEGAGEGACAAGGERNQSAS